MNWKIKHPIIAIKHWLKKIKKTSKPCYNCGGKGYTTQYRGTFYHADFIGDKSFHDRPKVQRNPCKCNITN